MRLTPVALLAGVLLTATPAADAAQTTFRVTRATHTSTVTRTATGYSGSSTASWSLATPTSTAPNRLQVARAGGTVTGLAQVNVAGSYGVDVRTDRGTCAFTARTGDGAHAASAPGPFTLTVGPDPRTGRGARATFMAASATLGSPDLPSECSTDVSGEPDASVTSSVAVAPKAFKRRTLTLRFAGTRTRDGLTTTWRTTITLRRR